MTTHDSNKLWLLNDEGLYRLALDYLTNFSGDVWKAATHLTIALKTYHVTDGDGHPWEFDPIHEVLEELAEQQKEAGNL